MVLRKYKKSSKRQLRGKKKRTNTKRRRRVQKGGVYPNDAIKSDGTPFTREEYINLLKTHIGLTDNNILAIEGNPYHSRDGIDHSDEYDGNKLMEFKDRLGEGFGDILNKMKSIILMPGTQNCRRWRDLSKDERDEFNYLLNISKIAIKHIQAQIIAHSPPGPRGRIRVMSVNDLTDLCETLKSTAPLNSETINNIVSDYVNTYFSRVKIPFAMKAFLIECLDGPMDPSRISMSDITSDIFVTGSE
jgi:hypothetical protein